MFWGFFGLLHTFQNTRMDGVCFFVDCVANPEGLACVGASLKNNITSKTRTAPHTCLLLTKSLTSSYIRNGHDLSTTYLLPISGIAFASSLRTGYLATYLPATFNLSTSYLLVTYSLRISYLIQNSFRLSTHYLPSNCLLPTDRCPASYFLFCLPLGGQRVDILFLEASKGWPSSLSLSCLKS